MAYDENLLVELVAEGELSHGEIAERVGTTRRTVWSIANSRTRPDLQQEIADTVQGYRAATVRLAAKHMQTLLKKQIEVALEDSGETARKAREFLLKHFMQILADEPRQSADKRRARLDEKEQIQADIDFERKLQSQREDDPYYWTAEDWARDRAEYEAEMKDNDNGATASTTDSTDSTDGYGHGDDNGEDTAIAADNTDSDDNGDGSRPEANTQRPSYGDGKEAGNGNDNDDAERGFVKEDPFGRSADEDTFAANLRVMRQASSAATDRGQ